jgi:hypothetical protein
MENLHEVQSDERRNVRKDGDFTMELLQWKIWPRIAPRDATPCGKPCRAASICPDAGAPIAAGQADVACAWAAAAARRQSRHRQSPPVVGIGSFAGSAAHQQSPESSQPNSVPQPEQVRRRLGGILPEGLRAPLRFVI